MEMAAVVASHGPSLMGRVKVMRTLIEPHTLSQPCSARSTLTRHDARGILHIIFSDDSLPRDICCFLPSSFALLGNGPQTT